MEKPIREPEGHTGRDPQEKRHGQDDSARERGGRQDGRHPLEEPFVSDAVYDLRVGQRKQIDNYPVFAWSSPIWVTRRS